MEVSFTMTVVPSAAESLANSDVVYINIPLGFRRHNARCYSNWESSIRLDFDWEVKLYFHNVYGLEAAPVESSKG